MHRSHIVLTCSTIAIGLPKSSIQFCTVKQSHRSVWNWDCAADAEETVFSVPALLLKQSTAF